MKTGFVMISMLSLVFAACQNAPAKQVAGASSSASAASSTSGWEYDCVGGLPNTRTPALSGSYDIIIRSDNTGSLGMQDDSGNDYNSALTCASAADGTFIDCRDTVKGLLYIELFNRTTPPGNSGKIVVVSQIENNSIVVNMGVLECVGGQLN